MDAEDVKYMRRLVEIANARFDGHLTVLKFTTNWRVAFQTPSDRDDIDDMPVGKTFIDAARSALEFVGEAGEL